MGAGGNYLRRWQCRKCGAKYTQAKNFVRLRWLFKLVLFCNMLYSTVRRARGATRRTLALYAMKPIGEMELRRRILRYAGLW